MTAALRRVLGFAMLCFGALELGFVGTVARVLTRGQFIAWSGSWCVLLAVVGLAVLVRGLRDPDGLANHGA